MSTNYPDKQGREGFPPQHQDRQRGRESQMAPEPIFDHPTHKGSGKLEGQVAIITGGDSGSTIRRCSLPTNPRGTWTQAGDAVRREKGATIRKAVAPFD